MPAGGNEMLKTGRHRRACFFAGVAALALIATSSQAAELTFQIPPQLLSDALRSFGLQSGQSISFQGGLTGSDLSPGAVGHYEPEEALRRILAGSGLSYVRSGGGIVIVEAPKERPAKVVKITADATVVTLTAPTTIAPTTSPAGGPALEQIVVTARKREENLLTVPLAVAVMSSTAIQNTGVKTVRDLAQFTPGLLAQTQSVNGFSDRSQVRLTFRGLSQANGISFIDGAPYAGSATPDIADVQRVEVLKGPQSVYFGRSTFAGAVNYVTTPPGNEFAGRVSSDIYSYNGADNRAMLQGPLLGDLLRIRVTGRRYSFGGQYRNGYDGQRLGGQSTTEATVALASSPTHNLHLSAYSAFTLDDDGPPPDITLRQVGPGPTLNCPLGGTGGNYWCGALPTLSQYDPRQFGNYAQMDAFTHNELINNVRGAPVPFRTNWLEHFGLKRRVNHLHAKADYTTDSGWEISFLGGWSKTQTAYLQGKEGLDTSATPNTLYYANPNCTAAPGSAANALCLVPRTNETTVLAQNIVDDYNAELRVSTPSTLRLRATAGVSYFGFTGPMAQAFGIQNSGRLITAGGGGLQSKANTPAVFGGVYFDVTDKLKLSAEARYQWDGIIQQTQYPVATQKLKQVFPSFSPRVTIDYTIAPRQLLYATYSRGYKPGGFNTTLIGQPQSVLNQLSGLGTNISFQQEQLDNFEVGHKARWLDNRLQTTLALYYMKWRNGQVANSLFALSPSGSNLSFGITSNVGQINLRGVELETDFAVTHNLTLSGTLDYADNKIIAYVYTPNGLRIRNNTNVTGNQPDQQPKVTISLSPTYKHEIVNGWDGFARLDYLYRSRIYVDPTDVAWRGASNIFNVHVGATSDKGLRFEAYVNNLFDNGVVIEAAKNSDSNITNNPGISCPPCLSAAFPPVTSLGVGALNTIGVGPPNRRTVGIRASYEF
jgi:iron complex outermembrane receptor protein